MNTQPKLGTRKLHRTASKTEARLLVKYIPNDTTTAERTAATQNTVLSILGPSDLCSTGLLPRLPFGQRILKHTLLRHPGSKTQALYRVVQLVSSCCSNRRGRRSSGT